MNRFVLQESKQDFVLPRLFFSEHANTENLLKLGVVAE